MSKASVVTKDAGVAKKAVAHDVHATAALPLDRYETCAWYFGLVMLSLLLPVVGPVVGAAVLWDALDRGFMGRPLEGILMTTAAWWNRKTKKFNEQFVKNKADAYLVNTLLVCAIFIPSLFFYSLYNTTVNGFSYILCFAYHVIRIGPYFMNFAYVYTLCHKEGHTRIGLFAGIWNKPLSKVFNWWVGLFYGVLPATFAYGHSINHHKYNNGPLDVITTSDKPRDSVTSFLCYMPRWMSYSINLSSFLQFYAEGNMPVAISMVTGTLYFLTWFGLIASVNFQFAFWYIIYPLGENIILLACVNWCWHAFLSAEDPEDEYVGSVTIFDGPINVLNEDFHVVHHQYPGAHWTTHPKLYSKHEKLNEYKEHQATIFKNTHVFELFFLIILGAYDEMAAKFVDLNEKLTLEEKKELIKLRLHTCWWGRRANLNIKLQNKAEGNYDAGRPFDSKKSN
jgi:hypothetical protein